MTDWRYDMENAPRDGRPIVGLCDHEADERETGGGSLTLYAAHYEGLSYAENGPNVLVWGGAVEFSDDEGGGYLPDWWFVKGSEFEVAANPVAWVELPA